MWEKSEVMGEFLKIAQDKGLFKVALPEKNPYQEDLKTIEEKKNVTEDENIIEKAHPEPVYIAEAQGDGGLVENQCEQQKKIIQIVNKMPNTNLVGYCASAVNELIKLANKCDEIGEIEIADILTNATNKLISYLETNPLS